MKEKFIIIFIIRHVELIMIPVVTLNKFRGLKVGLPSTLIMTSLPVLNSPDINSLSTFLFVSFQVRKCIPPRTRNDTEYQRTLSSD